ncbi:MAG: hypothetical protein A3A28_03330 [Candidatus Sungbacteria bacterium RIFCSPLOWO2_01_FULL_47_32]|nr:MAG: hypothetical protein A3A28_03330 [Candidatus Sungbacteria bacterium RIFCSPLOWO2_01_FULL_47_32]
MPEATRVIFFRRMLYVLISILTISVIAGSPVLALSGLGGGWLGLLQFITGLVLFGFGLYLINVVYVGELLYTSKLVGGILLALLGVALSLLPILMLISLMFFSDDAGDRSGFLLLMGSIVWGVFGWLFIMLSLACFESAGVKWVKNLTAYE